jgi:heptosyltransferase-2/heptosyltransferase-3
MHGGNRRRASNTKYWPEQCWAQVLRGLRALHPEHTILLLGVGPEAQINEEILALAKVSDAHNLAHVMTVPRLMALSASAVGMISVDTGPAHVAAALGCSVVALFDSPSKLAMYEPRGHGALVSCLVGGTDAAPSLLGIAPEAVLASWRGLRLAEIGAHQESA